MGITISTAIKKTVRVSSSKEVKEMVTQTVKKAAQELVALGFKTETDPFGKRWKKKIKPNGKPTLIATGKMRKSFRYQAFLTKIKITNAQPYAIFHLTGKWNMPARQYLPYAASSKMWKSYIDKKVNAKLAKELVNK